MPRQTVDQPITTRAARERLTVRSEPYWRAIDAGVAIGYRKARKGGTWIARAIVDSNYREGALGRADDGIKAEGVVYLDYRQAVEKAKAWAAKQHHATAGFDASGPYTVAMAMNDYFADYKRRGRKGLKQTRNVIDVHILPALGASRVDRLSRQQIVRWRNSIADEAARLRSPKGAETPRRRVVDDRDADALRRRRVTANRILSVLKAALNYAHEEGKATDREAWSAVKMFDKSSAPKVRFLTDAEATRLAKTCPSDLRAIVVGALLTGMRYGEIARLRVADVHGDSGTITIATSKSGESRHIVLTDEGRVFFDAAAAGKPAGALVFTRDDGAAWGSSHQSRPLLDACQAAQIIPAVSFHILRHTYASRLAMRGTPMAVIAAQLGHAGTRMTERHYAHLGPSFVAETVRRLFDRTGLVEPSNITPITGRAVGV